MLGFNSFFYLLLILLTLYLKKEFYGRFSFKQANILSEYSDIHSYFLFNLNHISVYLKYVKIFFFINEFISLHNTALSVLKKKILRGFFQL